METTTAGQFIACVSFNGRHMALKPGTGTVSFTKAAREPKLARLFNTAGEAIAAAEGFRTTYEANNPNRGCSVSSYQVS